MAGLFLFLLAVPTPRAQTLRREFWVPVGEGNAAVQAVAVTDSVIYLGGRFTHVAPVVGGGALIDAGSAATLEPYLRVEGTVNAAAPDANGGWYIGGAFTAVLGEPRHNLAQVDAAGNLTSWNPNASDPVIALVSTGTTVYVGGDFFQVGGQFRSRIAALDAVTGDATNWNPNADGPVKAFAIAGNTVYVGGGFLAVGGQARNNIAALDASTGLATSWNPDADNAVETLVLRGSLLYAGGFFTHIGGATRSMIAALDLASGAASSWNPGANGGVLTLAVHELPTFPFTVTVYAGGQFTQAGGQPRSSLAALDGGTGQATSWDPSPNGVVHSLRLRSNFAGSIIALHAAGEFTSIGGQSRARLASFNGAGAVASWNPNAGGAVNTLELGAGTVFVGGAFQTVGGQPRNHLAALHAVTGRPTSWNPDADGPVWSLAVSGGTVYAGGTFSSIGGQTRYSVAALDGMTGAATSWNPGALTTGAPLADVSAVAVHGGRVYLGGNFTIVGGDLRNRIAAVDEVTGLVSGWNPNANGHVRALAVHERDVFPFTTTVYAGGEFGNIGGQPRFSLAALDVTSGAATSWAPNPNSDVFAIAVSADDQPPFPVTVHIGGQFTQVAGEPRRNLAAIDGAASATPWDPDPDAAVFALMASSGVITAGGAFNSVGGLPRTGVAALDASTGSALLWNANATGSVLSLGAGAETVYLGGSFQSILGLPYTNFAALSQAVVGVEPVHLPPVRIGLRAAPNPFRTEMSVRFSLATSLEVHLSIHDLGGRRVRVLRRGVLPTGEHRVKWDGHDDAGRRVAPGVYFVRLISGDVRSSAHVIHTR